MTWLRHSNGGDAVSTVKMPGEFCIADQHEPIDNRPQNQANAIGQTFLNNPDVSRCETQRVVVDLTRIKHLYCGLGQFSLHLGRALARAAHPTLTPELLVSFRNHRLLAGSGAASHLAYPWMREKVLRYFRPLATRLGLPTSKCALWHATTQFPRYLPLDQRVPVILTIHDLNFLREKPAEICRRNLRSIQTFVDRASAVTTISHFVAAEIRQHLDLRQKPLRVIYNGLIADDYPDTVRPTFMDDRPFLFAIGDIVRKKNFHVLVNLMTRLPQYRLIIAGNNATPYAEDIRQSAARSGLGDRVFLSGIASDATRYWLYKHCTAFVFPSFTEGFGLPVIEAMRFGKPVFVSDTTSLPEIGGPLAFYWPSFDTDAMHQVFKTGMATFSSDPKYPAHLAARAKMFSWDTAAAEYMALYAQVLEGARDNRLSHAA
jgi:glycosyltransferase involved in cell wall biosynthesis